MKHLITRKEKSLANKDKYAKESFIRDVARARQVMSNRIYAILSYVEIVGRFPNDEEARALLKNTSKSKVRWTIARIIDTKLVKGGDLTAAGRLWLRSYIE